MITWLKTEDNLGDYKLKNRNIKYGNSTGRVKISTISKVKKLFVKNMKHDTA